jgi:3-hydroxyacyl-CoA dehydrogenase
MRIEGSIALITIANPPVNALSQAVRQGLWDAVTQAETNPQVQAMVILGDGRAFIAGADIKEFGKPPQQPHLPDLCTRIEASIKPVIAAMHGVSLGGGLEVALGCHYRIATATAKVGLPEVNLGLIPGAGATQRLPRLVGTEAGIDLMVSGRPVDAAKALEMGIVDEIGDADPRANGLALAHAVLDENRGPRAVSALPAPAAIDWDAKYDAVLNKGRGQISPAQVVRAVQAASELPFAQGLKREREIFLELMQSDQRQGMIHAFFGERAVATQPDLKGIEARGFDHIGVIGGGTMGAGIATAALLAGLSVTVLEMTHEASDAARGRVIGNLQGALKRGKISQAQFTKMTEEALTLSTDYAALAQVDMVIEAVFENMDVKKQVFAKLGEICKAGAVLATNTSYLDVNEIAAASGRAEDVIGLHFFSPAHVMKLLEIVVHDHTAKDVIATGFALGKRLGKVSVRAGVCDGFIGNRILAAYRAVSDHMVLDGASPFDIDRAVTDFGFPMGPFAMTDLAGLDIAWAARKRRRVAGLPEGARDATYADKLCEAGQLGQKAGKGFYTYEAGKRGGTPNPAVMDFVSQDRAEQGLTPRGFTQDEIIDRYMAAMVNEAARIVDEGIAQRPVDVDMVMLFGYGFPRYHGGPLKWADLQGLDKILARIETYAKENPQYWEPAPLLVKLVAEGRRFADLNG